MATSWSSTRHLQVGIVGIVAGLGGFALWAVFTTINGAVVASGEVAVEARPQAIQHHDGGIVATIHVKEGQVVKAGDPLVTLDGTEVMAQHALVRRDLAEVLVQLDRLKSELLDRKAIAFRPEVLAMRTDVAGLDKAFAEETALFEARRSTLQKALSQLDERTRQEQAQIDGRQRQIAASIREIAFVREDLLAQEVLFTKGLAIKTRILSLRRDEARIQGEISDYEANIAAAQSAIAGLDLERLRLLAEFREKAQDELRTLLPKEAELREKLRVSAAQMSRLVLRAPMAGAVLGLQVHTIGGVIPPGAEVASIIPSATPLMLFAEIDPRQIDRVRAGQTAKIRFPNFDARTTPEVDASVVSVSAGTITEPKQNRQFYHAELAMAPASLLVLGHRPLIPGMPVEVFIQTDARSPASFLLKPLADYWAYAMREE